MRAGCARFLASRLREVPGLRWTVERASATSASECHRQDGGSAWHGRGGAHAAPAHTAHANRPANGGGPRQPTPPPETQNLDDVHRPRCVHMSQCHWGRAGRARLLDRWKPVSKSGPDHSGPSREERRRRAVPAHGRGSRSRSDPTCLRECRITRPVARRAWLATPRSRITRAGPFSSAGAALSASAKVTLSYDTPFNSKPRHQIARGVVASRRTRTMRESQVQFLLSGTRRPAGGG